MLDGYNRGIDREQQTVDYRYHHENTCGNDTYYHMRFQVHHYMLDGYSRGTDRER
jgi:hypothetical protein